MDLGDLDGQDADAIRAALRQANGGVSPTNGAINLSGMSRASKESELRRLEEEVRPMLCMNKGPLCCLNVHLSVLCHLLPRHVNKRASKGTCTRTSN